MSEEGVGPSRARRMLPSVSEILKEVTARAPIEPDIAFRAAREVCAEELKRIRDAGGDSVPLEELVQRALRRATGGAPAMPVPRPAPAAPPAVVPEPEPEPEPGPEPGPSALFVEPAAPFVEPAVDEPFAETTGAMDLAWDGDAREPFTEPAAAAPFLPVPPAGPDEPGSDLAPPEPGPWTPGEAPSPFGSPAEEGPGDETLTRLSREAESIDLQSVFPGVAGSPRAPYVPAGQEAEEPYARPEVVEPPPAPFEDDEDTVLTIPRGRRAGGDEKWRGVRPGVVLGTAAVLAGLAGLGYVLVGLWVERDAAPPPVAVARPRPTAAPVPALVEETPGPDGAATAPQAAPTVPSTDAPAVAAQPRPEPAASPAAARETAPSPVPVATVVPAPPRPDAGAPPVRQSRDGLVITRDRAGQAQVFSIHFTSYRDRASADRDLKRISALVGREGYVAEVDLGEKGVWQRVMIGAFQTAQEARAAREELAAKGTRDMGWVYRVIGPEAAEQR